MEPTTEQPQDVVMINHEARVYQLVINGEPSEASKGENRGPAEILPTTMVRLLPGLNFVPVRRLQEAGLRLDGDQVVGYEGKLSIAAVETLTPFHAIQLAHSTNSRSALSRWLETERRDGVRNAIQERLASID